MTFAEKILGKAQPDKVPFEVLVNKVVTDLYMVFVGNGYKHVGFSLVAHDTETGDTVGAGNLKAEGVKALLTDYLEHVEAREAQKPALPN